eukprot:327642-Alexandrium_andersonii.AAC.1
MSCALELATNGQAQLKEALQGAACCLFLFGACAGGGGASTRALMHRFVEGNREHRGMALFDHAR